MFITFEYKCFKKKQTKLYVLLMHNAWIQKLGFSAKFSDFQRSIYILKIKTKIKINIYTLHVYSIDQKLKKSSLTFPVVNHDMEFN